MSLYDDIEMDPIPVTISAASNSKSNTNSKIDLSSPSAPASLSSTPQTTTSAANKMNLSFLKSQLEARKALLQNATNAAASQQKSASGRHLNITPATQNSKPALRSSTFKLKPHRAVPLPLDTSGAFTIVPKALKEDKVFLFGEIMIEDEYNPTAPTEYGTYKAKREQQKLKEKIAKEIADRLARESMEEEEKRRKGAAIAPPSSFQKEDEEEEPKREEAVKMEKVAPKLTHQFGKGVSRGLGVATSIMSKMGYREGDGLGANKQGISRPLEVQRTGRNIGLILAEEKAQTVVTHLNEPGGRGECGGWAKREEENEEVTTITPTMELLKSATRIVLLKNILLPSQFDANFESELRQEMAKYGQLINVQFFQMEKCAETEAIRVFLEFSNQAQAIKALIDLNGRFYGGRQCRATFYPLEEYSNGKLDTEILT